MFSYQNAPLIITALIIIVILGIILFVLRLKDTNEKITEDFLEQLRVASGEEFYERTNGKSTKNKFVDKFIFLFGTKLKQADLAPKEATSYKIALFVFLSFIIIYILSILIFRNFGIGLIPIFLMILLINMQVNARIEAKNVIFEDQIPGFLSILKSNVQAGETPERALMGAIANTNNPLYNELKIAESLTQSGTFHVALSTLREQTSNETLKFLCGCIELSASVGANLEEQIEIIEEMLEAKRSLKRKLAVAVSENRPLVYVSCVLIPGLFMFTYLTNQATREFWFQNLVSWVAFALICAIFGAGIYFSEKTIKNTSKF